MACLSIVLCGELERDRSICFTKTEIVLAKWLWVRKSIQSVGRLVRINAIPSGDIQTGVCENSPRDWQC